MSSGNPGDKPGYKLVKLTGDPATDTSTVNTLADEGYRFVAVASDGYLLFGNYE